MSDQILPFTYADKHEVRIAKVEAGIREMLQRVRPLLVEALDADEGRV